MPLFGEKKREQNEALHAEVERVAALSLTDLAGEVMVKGFGPGGPAADGAIVSAGTIAGAFNPADGSFGIDDDALSQLYLIVVEGLHVLEHACLVRFTVTGSGGVYEMDWTSTRYGRAVLEQNAVERVLGGGTL